MIEQVFGYINILIMISTTFLFKQIFLTALLFPVIFIAARLLKNRFIFLQYGLWLILISRLILPTDLSSDYSLVSLFKIDLDFHRMLSDQAIGQRAVNGQLPLVLAEQSNTSFMGEPIDSAVAGPWQIGFFAFWLIGAAALFIVYLRRYTAMRKILKTAEPIRCSEARQRLIRWKKILRIKREVRLCASDAYLMPFASGIIRPAIFIPTVLLKDRQCLDSVIAHELAHIKRFDNLTLVLQNMLQIVYFFFPPLWLALREINALREQICDALVLRHRKIQPSAYGAALLKIIGLNSMSSNRLQFTTAFSGYKKTMKRRIQNIMERKTMSKKQNWFGLILLAPLAFFLLPMTAAETGNGNAFFMISADSVHSQIMEKPNFIKPVNGRLTSGFGNRMHPIQKVTKHHNGIDLAAPTGTPVYAAASGTVRLADFRKGWGRLIIIDHKKGYETRYGQLDTISVQKGQVLSEGELIGEVGSSGLSTAPHLHFEIRKDNQPQNPMRWFK